VGRQTDWQVAQRFQYNILPKNVTRKLEIFILIEIFVYFSYLRYTLGLNLKKYDFHTSAEEKLEENLDFLKWKMVPRKTVSGKTETKLHQSANGLLKNSTILLRYNKCLKYSGILEKKPFENGQKWQKPEFSAFLLASKIHQNLF
jgi:hypothetical protein